MRYLYGILVLIILAGPVAAFACDYDGDSNPYQIGDLVAYVDIYKNSDASNKCDGSVACDFDGDSNPYQIGDLVTFVDVYKKSDHKGLCIMDFVVKMYDVYASSGESTSIDIYVANMGSNSISGINLTVSSSYFTVTGDASATVSGASVTAVTDSTSSYTPSTSGMVGLIATNKDTTGQARVAMTLVDNDNSGNGLSSVSGDGALISIPIQVGSLSAGNYDVTVTLNSLVDNNGNSLTSSATTRSGYVVVQ